MLQEIKIPVDYVTPGEKFTMAVNPPMIEDILNKIPPARIQVDQKRNLFPNGFQIVFKLGEYLLIYYQNKNTPLLIFIHKSNSPENISEYLKVNKLGFIIGELEFYEALQFALKEINSNPDTKNKIVWGYHK